MTKKHCRVCGVELSEENWGPSRRKDHGFICKECHNEQGRLWRKANPEKARTQLARWRKANPEKVRAQSTRRSRKQGMRPFNENKECALYLGVHVAERVLNHVFKDVEVMPMGNPGYDFICNHNKMIDIKSSCLHKNNRWLFCIWLLPGHKFNHLTGTSISQSTVHKWDEYRLDISKVSDCCNTIRGD